MTESNSKEPYEPLVFETNLLVLGYAAVVYSNQCPTAPQRHWGAGLSNNALRVENDRYRFGRVRMMSEDGIQITKDTNHYGGGEKSTRGMWIPFSQLNHLTVSARGKAIGG